MKEASVLDLGPYRLPRPDAGAVSGDSLPDFVRNWFAVSDRELARHNAA